MQRIVLCTLVAGILAGCGVLDFGKKTVKENIESLQYRVEDNRWKDAGKLMAAKFTYTDVDGKEIEDGSKPFGKYAWKRSIIQIPNRIEVRFSVSDVRKKGTTYVALVTTYADVQRNQSDTKSVSWKTRQIWRKEKNVWKLARVQDLSSPKNLDKPASMARKSTAASEVSSGIDYATGTTQLKTKRRITRKLDEINKQENERRK